MNLSPPLALTMGDEWRLVLSGAFFLVALVFVYRSFYGMRIQSTREDQPHPVVEAPAAPTGGAVESSPA